MTAATATNPTTLPASWFTSQSLYQMERRGVFFKAWHILGPITRFHGHRDKVNYEIAQIKFTVQATSASKPEAEEVVALRDDGNQLHHHITPNGLVFVAISDEAPSFDEFFPDLLSVAGHVDFRKRPYRRSIVYEGRYNWKTMIDGYQECLHCKYTHPNFSKMYPTTFYKVHPHTNFTQHIADPNKPNDGLFLYFFPIYAMGVYGGGMNVMRACPAEDTSLTRMEFDYYHSGTDEEFEEYFKFVRQVAMEDFELCETAQANLRHGVYTEGILNPEKENGIYFYQGLVRERVMQQHALEKAQSNVVAANA